MKVLLVLTAAIDILGCVRRTEFIWDKPGTTQAEYDQDRYACFRESRVQTTRSDSPPADTQPSSRPAVVPRSCIVCQSSASNHRCHLPGSGSASPGSFSHSPATRGLAVLCFTFPTNHGTAGPHSTAHIFLRGFRPIQPGTIGGKENHWEEKDLTLGADSRAHTGRRGQGRGQ